MRNEGVRANGSGPHFFTLRSACWRQSQEPTPLLIGQHQNRAVRSLATIANAIANAVGVRMTEVPMSPPRVLKAIHAAKG